MYLSDKKAGKPRQLADHEDLEVLLESFSKQVEELVNESETTLVSPPLWRLRPRRRLAALYVSTVWGIPVH